VSKLDNILFYASMSFLLLCIFLTFLFFGPKKIIEKEEFVFVTSDKKEMLNLTLELIEEGDLLLSRPKSLIGGYEYDTKNRINLNQLTYFFWYNIFDKLIINSMGNTYWHIGIYIGQEKINSLYQGVYEHEINENLINYKYFKVLKIKTSEENKILAIKRAKEHFKKQDVYYSNKNGLIIVYLESIGSKRIYSLKENELVCSSYIGLIYNEIKFNDKPFTHLTPVALEFSEKVETKFLVNETGFFIKK